MRRLLIVMACLALAACSKKPDPMDAPVASWNGVQVTLAHFIQEYELYGSYAPITDDLPTRIDYAKLMLERMVIAERAREAGLDTSRIVRETIRRRTEMASRAHLFQIKVRPAVKPATEAEIREAFRRANTRVFTQQIYAPTRAMADSLRALLVQGVSFDELARQTTGGTGIMGWVTFDMLDEGPEAVLLSMTHGTVSEPVESLRGWHIFKALEVEETVHFDEGTYRNNRERLRFKVDQRRFDEASARWQRAQVEPIPLATDVRVLRDFYRQLGPLLPQRDVPDEIARFNREVLYLKPELPPDTPIAMVGGKPFTVAQFLYQLPDIPYHWVRSNPIEALQVAIRDSILADVARRTVRPDTARAVMLASEVARYTALYHAGMRQGLDTIDVWHDAPEWYERLKDSHFLLERTSRIEIYRYPDSTAAVRDLLAYQATRTWAPTSGSPLIQDISSKLDPKHPANRMRMASTTRLAGPFNVGGKWDVYRLIDQQTRHLPFEDARASLLGLLNERKLTLTHERLLPSGFNRDDIRIDTTAIRNAL